MIQIPYQLMWHILLENALNATWCKHSIEQKQNYEQIQKIQQNLQVALQRGKTRIHNSLGSNNPIPHLSILIVYSPVTLRNYTRTFIPTWNWREKRPTYVIFPRKYGIQSTSLEYTLTFADGNHKWVTNLWLSHRDRHWHVNSISRIEKTTCNCITLKHNSTYGWWWHALSMDETYIKTTSEASFKLILQTAIHISSQL